MCLLVLAWRAHPRFPLIVAANRDEFHERPAAPLGQWDGEGIYGGRDLRAGGTWLAVDGRRRFGVITNFRDLQKPRPAAPSRGELIPEYLRQEGGPKEFLARLEPRAGQYSGFNLLLADRDELWYGANRAEDFARALPPGIHGLSNQFLDTPWPKLLRVKRRFAALLENPAGPSEDDLFAMLDDRNRATADEELPQTGLTQEWERILSSPFVLHPNFGTRCSTVVLLEAAGELRVVERRFDAQGSPAGASEIRLSP